MDDFREVFVHVSDFLDTFQKSFLSVLIKSLGVSGLVCLFVASVTDTFLHKEGKAQKYPSKWQYLIGRNFVGRK